MSENWIDRIPMLSVNPDAATREDVARMAANLMATRHELIRLRDIVSEADVESIDQVLEDLKS